MGEWELLRCCHQSEKYCWTISWAYFFSLWLAKCCGRFWKIECMYVLRFSCLGFFCLFVSGFFVEVGFFLVVGKVLALNSCQLEPRLPGLWGVDFRGYNSHLKLGAYFLSLEVKIAKKLQTYDLAVCMHSLPRNISLMAVPVTAKRINGKAELGLCLSLIQISYYAVNLAAVKLGCKHSSWRIQLHEFINERTGV